MRRLALAALAAAVTLSLPAAAQTYCAAVVPNDSVKDLKKDIKDALTARDVLGRQPINNWPDSNTKMLEVGADQGTAVLKDDMWGSGLALHATLCTSRVECQKAITFFQAAGRKNNLKRFGTDERAFRYTDLKTAYQALLKDRPLKLGTGSFEGADWGTWFAFTLSPSPLKASSEGGDLQDVEVTGALHVSFIKVKFASKDSTNGQKVQNAIRDAAAGKEITIKFTEVKCSGG